MENLNFLLWKTEELCGSLISCLDFETLLRIYSYPIGYIPTYAGISDQAVIPGTLGKANGVDRTAGEKIVNLNEVWPNDLHEDLLQFLEYWKSLMGEDGTPPKRSQFDPKLIVSLLPGILIFERIFSPERGVRYKYRLVGTGHYGANDLRDLTGKYLDEVYEEAISSHAYETYDRILNNGEPHYWSGPAMKQSEQFKNFERVIAPLCNDQGQPTMLIGMWVWHT